MARYQGTVPSVSPQAATFDYLARFSNTPDWDPGALEGRDDTDGAPVAVGSTFSLDFKIGPTTQLLVYEVIEYERPGRIRLKADGGWFESDDVIEVAPRGENSDVTYTAIISLKGPLKLFDPIMRLGFGRVGDKSAEGLREELSKPR